MDQLNSAARARVLDILQKGRDMTLATIRPDGYPLATTVSYVHEGLTIYAVTGLGSQKADNIQHNNKVSAAINLDYQDWHHIRGISLAGTCEFVHGADQIAHVTQALLAKFPEARQFFHGAESLPWQGLLFLHICPTVISLLDYRLGFGHTELYAVPPHEKPD